MAGLRKMKYALTLPVGEDKSYKVQGADYFADWVYREVNDYIGERDNDIYVYTTLDQKIQENAEKILREAVLAAKNRNVSEGAVVVLNKSGDSLYTLPILQLLLYRDVRHPETNSSYRQM